MRKHLVWVILSLIVLGGCSTHTPDPNVRMMDKVIGELDRETAK